MLRGAAAVACVMCLAPASVAGAWPDVEFQPYQAYATGSWPEAVAIGDVTSDGRADVLVTTSAFFDSPNRWSLFVFSQTVDGGLVQSQVIPTGSFGDTMSVAVGDLNGDGANDAAVATEHGVQVFAQADGALQPGVFIEGSPQRVVQVLTFDEDSDGRTDLGLVTRDGIHVLRRLPGGAGWEAARLSAEVPEEIESGDLNGDGRADIAAARPSNLAAFEQQGDGTYLERMVPVRPGLRPRGLAVADVEGGDGLDDLVVSGSDLATPSDVVHVYAQVAGGGSASQPVVYGEYDGPNAVETAGIDAVSPVDVAVVEDRGIALRMQEFAGGLGPALIVPTPKPDTTRVDGLALGDVNSDGHTDIAIAESREFGLVVLRQFPASAYVRPKGATPVRVPLVPAYVACAAPNRIHGPPLAHDACARPEQTSSELTVGTPDSNGYPADMVGKARFTALLGNPATTTNDADVALAASVSGVRRRETLFDYTGEIEVTASVQITDRGSSAQPGERVTVQDIPLGVTVPCLDTNETSTGSTCSIMASFNAVLPGSVVKGNRAIWELGEVTVRDGGPDGSVQTEPNTVFATQGLFVP